MHISVLHLDVPLCSNLMVPQDDLAVFSSSGQESATPHLTHAENAALVSFDLSSDLERCPDTDLFV